MVELGHRCPFCPIRELVFQSCQSLYFSNNCLVHVHFVHELLPDDFVFEHHSLAISDGHELKEEVFQSLVILRAQDLIQPVDALEVIQRHVIQEVCIIDLGQDLG